MNKGLEISLKYRKKFVTGLFDTGIGARLPAAYKKFYDEWRNTAPAPVHYKPYEGCQWQRNPETGEIKRVENVALPLRFPKELHSVFTGGEKIIQGLQRRKPRYFRRVPHYWTPILYENVVYSEILNKYFSIISTRRVLDLITEHDGFDSYILKTKACDLYSLVALKIKQRLLQALNDRKLPYDEEKNNKILEKYEKYLIPPEEIEWYSLSFSEACVKQERIEKAAEKVVPLKHIYRTELIKFLKQEPEKEREAVLDETSWKGKFPKLLNLLGSKK